MTATLKLSTFDHLAISHCLRSRQLDCGCTVGIYATFGNRILEVIDDTGEACRNLDHARGQRVDEGVERRY